MQLVIGVFLCFGVVVHSAGVKTTDEYDLNSEYEKKAETDEISDAYKLWKGDNSGTQADKHQMKNEDNASWYNRKDFAEFQRTRNHRNGNDEEERERLDDIFGYTGPTANDEPENLLRPCALDDWQCVRKFFAANSNCTPAYGPIPDPIKISTTLFFTTVNVTTNYPNSILRGLSTAKINDFYVNKKSGNLVFAIDIQKLNQTTPRAYYRYRRTGKESIILAGYSTVDFEAVTFTAVIPRVPHLRLDLADVHADIKNGYPPYFIAPEALTSTDPDVITAAAQFDIQLPFIVREALLFESQLLTAVYIQKNICDFGLNLVSL